MTNNYIKVYSPHTAKIVELVFFDDTAPSSLPRAEAYRFRREKGSAAFNAAARVKAEHDETLPALDRIRGGAVLSVWRKGCPGVPSSLLEIGEAPVPKGEGDEEGDEGVPLAPRPPHRLFRRIMTPQGGSL